MKNYLSILLLPLLIGTAHAAFVPNSNSISVGGQTFILPNPKFKSLVTAVSGANSSGTFRIMNGTSGYIVPGGKTYRLSAIRCFVNGNAGYLTPLYSDNDVGVATNTSFTNVVYVGGLASTGNNIFSLGTLTAGAINTIEVTFGSGFTVPTGKYPGLSSAGAGEMTCITYGTEE